MFKQYTAGQTIEHEYQDNNRHVLKVSDNVSQWVFTGTSTNTLKKQLEEIVTIGSFVTKLGNDCFNGATNLTEISSSCLKNVTEIGNNAFANCTNLKHVVLPDGLQTVGTGIFSNCTNLDMVTFDGFEDDNQS